MTAPSPRACALPAKVSGGGDGDTQICPVVPTGRLPGESARELSEMFPFDFILCAAGTVGSSRVGWDWAGDAASVVKVGN